MTKYVILIQNGNIIRHSAGSYHFPRFRIFFNRCGHGIAGDGATIQCNTWNAIIIIARFIGNSATIFRRCIFDDGAAFHNKVAAAAHIHATAHHFCKVIADGAAFHSECTDADHHAAARLCRIVVADLSAVIHGHYRRILEIIPHCNCAAAIACGVVIDFAVDVQLAVLGLDVDGAVSGLIVMDIGIFAKGNIEFTVLKIKSIGVALQACDFTIKINSAGAESSYTFGLSSIFNDSTIVYSQITGI